MECLNFIWFSSHYLSMQVLTDHIFYLLTACLRISPVGCQILNSQPNQRYVCVSVCLIACLCIYMHVSHNQALRDTIAQFGYK